MFHKLYLPNPHRQALRDMLVSRADKEPSYGGHNIGGWRSDSNMLDDTTSELIWLKRELRGAIDRLPLNFKVRTLQAWGVVNPPGGYHNRHVHRWGFAWTGIYYLDPGGEHSGRTMLEIKGVEVAVEPEPDLLIVFPYNLWHRSEPHGGTRKRVLVAFDAS